MASHQNKFGRAFEIDDFSQHLGNFFGNSNLPKRMKQRFRDLYE
jgi:hypothetical protein